MDVSVVVKEEPPDDQESFPNSTSAKNQQPSRAVVKPYQCEHRGKAFSQSQDLITHQHVHTETPALSHHREIVSMRLAMPADAL
ncbi:hypothetical protein LDENG_00181790 [Lucifuga dentata]|nr:hypothetical protein LDENG_00181790 [Lucifuga dentata]